MNINQTLLTAIQPYLDEYDCFAQELNPFLTERKPFLTRQQEAIQIIEGIMTQHGKKELLGHLTELARVEQGIGQLEPWVRDHVVHALLSFAGTLSGGERQMLAIGRALMSVPKLILLDEPSTGLSPVVVQHLVDILVTLNREERLTMLIVEQNARLALDIADRGYLLQTGSVVASGKASDLMGDEAVRAAYLGMKTTFGVVDRRGYTGKNC